MDELLKYFPELTAQQRRQFDIIGRDYPIWNERINVISRKDIDSLYEHHILHSLSIAKFLTPSPGTRFLDLGTGGGFPGIPLAIMWPHCTFHLIDRIGKKLTVAKSIAESAGLNNVTFQHGDAGECHEKFDFVISRAVMNLKELARISARNIGKRNHNSIPNGLICLKGGDLSSEIAETGRDILEVPLSDYFSEEYFITKELIYLPL